MISEINNDGKCYAISAGSLEEEGIRVGFGSSLLGADGEIDDSKVAILKPDMFYNTKVFATPPKSVDGVVVVGGDSNAVHVYVAELKSASKLRNIKKAEIQEKFSTVFTSFFNADFKHIFVDLDYTLKSMSLWLVCDPTNIRASVGRPEELARKMQAVATLRTYLAVYSSSLRPYSFKGVTAPIQAIISPPVIEHDHYVNFLDVEALKMGG